MTATPAPLGPADRAPGDVLFAYGTLQFPQVLSPLLGRCPRLSPLTLSGWRAAALTGRVYPGLVADAGARVRGRLLHGLTAAEWRVLDDFEGPEYALVRPDPARPEVLTYRWLGPVLDADWSTAEFAAGHLPGFVAASTPGAGAPRG
ncbi:gamma-glutamylcyclotransferase family protein [Nocardia thailandica]